MKQVWSGEPVRHQGRHFTIECGPVGPAPVQRPHPPVWMGAMREVALRRVARIADGFIVTGGAGPEGFAATWQRVRQMVADAGRAPDRFPNACLAYFNVGNDREQAKAQAMSTFVRYYEDAPLLRRRRRERPAAAEPSNHAPVPALQF